MTFPLHPSRKLHLSKYRNEQSDRPLDLPLGSDRWLAGAYPVPAFVGIWEDALWWTWTPDWPKSDPRKGREPKPIAERRLMDEGLRDAFHVALRGPANGPIDPRAWITRLEPAAGALDAFRCIRRRMMWRRLHKWGPLDLHP